MAQIADFVALLSDCTAAASHNNQRDPPCPGIPQLTKHVHISSFPPVKSWCRDCKVHQVPLGRSDRPHDVHSSSGTALRRFTSCCERTEEPSLTRLKIRT